MLTGQRTTVSGNQFGCGEHEVSEDRGAAGSVEREIDADVHAAVAEVAVGHPGDTEVGHQRIEVTEVVTQALRRHGCIFPTGMGGSAGCAAARQPGAVLADAPQRGSADRVVDHQ